MKRTSDFDDIFKHAKFGIWIYNAYNNQIKFSKSIYNIFPQLPTTFSPIQDLYINFYDEKCYLQFVKFLNDCANTNQIVEIRLNVSVTNGRNTKEMTVVKLIARKRNSNASGHIITGTIQEITEKMSLKQQLESEKSKTIHQSKLATIGELAVCMAHEVSTPLSVISGNATIISNEYVKNIPILKKVETIKKSADKISKIVTHMKKFSRSNVNNDQHPRNLVHIIKESLELTDMKAKKHDVKQIFENKCDQSLQILCDEIEIEQVIVNLINNSIDAVKDLPQKWVKIILQENSQKNKITLTIIDSGKGIPQEIKSKIFNSFFTTKVNNEGTGLGLSIVKNILTKHGATIEIVSSAPNTCFKITFSKAA